MATKNYGDGDDVTLTPARGGILALCVGLVAMLAGSFLSLPESSRLFDPVADSLEASGVENPVTAVLLNFRSYDTLLEVAVLLLAIIGIWAIAPHARIAVKTPDTPVLAAFVRLMLPLMLVIGGYIFWLGADNPGGAFQGGAILGGMGVLWVAAALWRPPASWAWLLRPALVLGVLVFVVLGLAVMLLDPTQRLLLAYPPEQAKTFILIIETAAVISIGLTLTLLFIGGYPQEREEH